MKKILSFLGTITLIGTSTTNLVACNKTPQEYTKEELEHLKKENQINTANQEIKNNLEGMAPQEKPFSQVDNKYYFVVWRGDKNDNGRIIKFKNNELKIGKIFDKYNQYTLELRQEMAGSNFDICVNYSGAWSPKYGESDDGTRFKTVYRGNLNTNILDLDVNNKTGEIKVD